MPFVSYDNDTVANDVTWAKSHVTSHFDDFDVRNAMVPFLMSLTSHDTHTNAHGVT